MKEFDNAVNWGIAGSVLRELGNAAENPAIGAAEKNYDAILGQNYTP